MGGGSAGGSGGGESSGGAVPTPCPPGKINKLGQCDPACCINNSECKKSNETCWYPNGFCNSGLSCKTGGSQSDVGQQGSESAASTSTDCSKYHGKSTECLALKDTSGKQLCNYWTNHWNVPCNKCVPKSMSQNDACEGRPVYGKCCEGILANQYCDSCRNMGVSSCPQGTRFVSCPKTGEEPIKDCNCQLDSSENNQKLNQGQAVCSKAKSGHLIICKDCEENKIEYYCCGSGICENNKCKDITEDNKYCLYGSERIAFNTSVCIDGTSISCYQNPINQNTDVPYMTLRKCADFNEKCNEESGKCIVQPIELMKCLQTTCPAPDTQIPLWYKCIAKGNDGSCTTKEYYNDSGCKETRIYNNILNEVCGLKTRTMTANLNIINSTNKQIAFDVSKNLYIRLRSLHKLGILNQYITYFTEVINTSSGITFPITLNNRNFVATRLIPIPIFGTTPIHSFFFEIEFYQIIGNGISMQTIIPSEKVAFPSNSQVNITIDLGK